MSELDKQISVSIDGTYPIFTIHMGEGMIDDITTHVDYKRLAHWLEIERNYFKMQHELGELIGYYE